jgi:dTDP-4-dehydrorhamnose reductase
VVKRFAFGLKCRKMADDDLLIIGGSGFVGGKLVEAALRAGWNVAYTFASHELPSLPAKSYRVKIHEAMELEACLADARPRTVVYCAVPHPGSDQDLHEIVSVDGIRRVISALDRSNPCKLIYVSTNAVFSGKSGPNPEDATPDPEARNDLYRHYAITRFQGERIALENWPNTIVARTADVNGKDACGRLNPRLIALVEQLQGGKEIERLCNAYISPTWVDNLAAALLEISQPDFAYQGVLHLAGSEPISYYDFARRLARQIGSDEQLVKADMSRSWNISLGTTFTQSILKTRLLGVQEQLSAIFS